MTAPTPVTAEQLAASIYIKGVNPDTSEEALREAFAPFGTVSEVALKAQRGFAFIQFASADAVAAAVASQVSVDGASVVVEARKPRERRPAPDSMFLYVNGLGEYSREEDLNVLGAKVVNVDMHQERGFAYVEMESVQAARDAVAMSPVMVNGQSIGVFMRRSRTPRRSSGGQEHSAAAGEQQPAAAPTGVYVRGLSSECSSDDLVKAFSSFGAVVNAAVKQREDRETGEPVYYAFVDFDSMDAVNAAVEAGPTVTVGDASGLVVEARKPVRQRAPGRRRNRRRRPRGNGAAAAPSTEA